MRFLLVLAAAALSLCAATPRPPDAQIEQTIRASYAKSRISVDHFTVRVKNGVATIEGKTDIIQRKGWATRYAKLGGATQVVNNIQVSEAAKARARQKLEAARHKIKTPATKSVEMKPAAVAVKGAVPGKPSAAPPAAPPVSEPSIKRAQIKH